MPKKILSLEQIDHACTAYIKAVKAYRAVDTSEKSERVFDGKLAQFTPKELREILFQIGEMVDVEALRAILPPWEKRRIK